MRYQNFKLFLEEFNYPIVKKIPRKNCISRNAQKKKKYRTIIIFSRITYNIFRAVKIKKTKGMRINTSYFRVAI